MAKNAWLPCVVVLAGCLIYSALAQQSAPPAKIPNTVEEPTRPQLLPVVANNLPGRYQAVSIGTPGSFLVIDTHTGQCWARKEHLANWRDLGSPVNAKE